jgi:hypothetical protein
MAFIQATSARHLGERFEVALFEADEASVRETHFEELRPDPQPAQGWQKVHLLELARVRWTAFQRSDAATTLNHPVELDDPVPTGGHGIRARHEVNFRIVDREARSTRSKLWHHGSNDGGDTVIVARLNLSKLNR